ncbi:hypothetical protein Aduo_003149 [Ancylostoma duodenale]
MKKAAAKRKSVAALTNKERRHMAAVASGIGGPSSPTRKTSWSTLIEGSNRRYSIAQLVFGGSTLARGSSGQLRDYWPDDDADSTGSAEVFRSRSFLSSMNIYGYHFWNVWNNNVLFSPSQDTTFVADHIDF